MLAGSLQKLAPVVGAPSRRHFLLGAAAMGGGLAVGFRAAEAADGPVQAQAPFAHTQVNPFSAYLTITPESLVVVHSAHMDMGQGPYHGLATLVAEELGADWSQMRADGAWGSTQFYGNLVWGGAMQGTGGSTAIASSFDRYRQAGAAARAMLIAAASSAWKVPKAEITDRQGRALASVRTARHIRRDRRRRRRGADPERGAAEGSEGLDLYRQPEPAAHRQPREVHRAGAVHHRRKARGNAHGRDDPSAAVRRHVEVVRRCQGKGGQGRR